MAGVLLLVVGLLLAACGGGGSSSASSTGDAGVPSLPFLHVATPPDSAADVTPYLADPAGRQVLLHGAAVVGMQDVAYPGADGGPAIFPVDSDAYDGRCPKASALIPQPPLCEVQADLPAYDQSTAPGSGDDLAQLRSLGFNVIRLVLNWSQLEPRPGVYSTEYLQRVEQVVGWAGQQGIYVILDMHQDQYSRYILPGDPSTLPAGCTSSGGSDGAPAWAVFTDGKPACALFGESDLNPAEGAAFYNFWQDHTVPSPKGASPGVGLQDHYIGALVALARTFEDNSTVLGYEVMNEPQPGSLSSVPVENLYTATAQDLFPFYQRVIEALTGVRDGLPTCPASDPTSLTNACAYPQLADVSRQQIFVEPLAYRNLVDFSPQVSKPFTQYRNLVWAPHVYTHAFTLDQFIGYSATDSPYPPNYTFGYQTAEYEAQALHAAVFTTEFGDSSSTDDTVLDGETAAQESTLTGGTVWAWKGLSQAEGTCWCVRWQHSAYQTTANGQPGKGDPEVPPSPKDLLIASRREYLSPRLAEGDGRDAAGLPVRPGLPHLRPGRRRQRRRAPRRPERGDDRLHPEHRPRSGEGHGRSRPRRGDEQSRREPGRLRGPHRHVVVRDRGRNAQRHDGRRRRRRGGPPPAADQRVGGATAGRADHRPGGAVVRSDHRRQRRAGRDAGQPAARDIGPGRGLTDGGPPDLRGRVRISAGKSGCAGTCGPTGKADDHGAQQRRRSSLDRRAAGAVSAGAAEAAASGGHGPVARAERGTGPGPVRRARIHPGPGGRGDRRW